MKRAAEQFEQFQKKTSLFGNLQPASKEQKTDEAADAPDAAAPPAVAEKNPAAAAATAATGSASEDKVAIALSKLSGYLTKQSKFDKAFSMVMELISKQLDSTNASLFFNMLHDVSKLPSLHEPWCRKKLQELYRALVPKLARELPPHTDEATAAPKHVLNLTFHYTFELHNDLAAAEDSFPFSAAIKKLRAAVKDLKMWKSGDVERGIDGKAWGALQVGFADALVGCLGACFEHARKYAWAKTVGTMAIKEAQETRGLWTAEQHERLTAWRGDLNKVVAGGGGASMGFGWDTQGVHVGSFNS